MKSAFFYTMVCGGERQRNARILPFLLPAPNSSNCTKIIVGGGETTECISECDNLPINSPSEGDILYGEHAGTFLFQVAHEDGKGDGDGQICEVQ